MDGFGMGRGANDGWKGICMRFVEAEKVMGGTGIVV